MNQLALPVADLASYWGSTCSYTFHESVRTDVPLTAGILQLVETCPHYISQFKIQLLSLESVTDTQLEQMARLAGITGPLQIRRRSQYGWVQADNESVFTLWYNGRVEVSDEQGKELAFNPAPVITFARRAGLYWPGTLPEDCVELIPYPLGSAPGEQSNRSWFPSDGVVQPESCSILSEPLHPRSGRVHRS